MGQIFGSNGNITMVDGSRVVWSNTRRPALLLPESAVTIENFEIAYPDFAKSNCYAFTYANDPMWGASSACVSFVSVDPQEWDSGLTYVCDLPPKANYFETELAITRAVTPSVWMSLGVPIPALLGAGQHMPDGNSAIIEGVGTILKRMFAFERVDDKVYLRRRQSVANDGPVVSWNSGNNNDAGVGGMRSGFTYGGNPNAWPSYIIEQKAGGNIYKRRGEGNACSLSDPTNYASLWRGTVTITPGFIKV